IYNMMISSEGNGSKSTTDVKTDGDAPDETKTDSAVVKGAASVTKTHRKRSKGKGVHEEAAEGDAPAQKRTRIEGLTSIANRDKDHVKTDADSAKDRDRNHYLSYDFLQHMASRLAKKGNDEARNESHPIWDSLIDEFILESHKEGTRMPKGMSQSRNTLLVELSTSVSNLMETNVYASLRDHLIDVLVRFGIRPVQEQMNQERIATKALYQAKKREEIEGELASGCEPEPVVRPQTLAQWQRTRTGLIDQLRRAIC
ncbi:hypothetical protein BGZ83_004680, partial [Gryganskiella cystojenkinii]